MIHDMYRKLGYINTILSRVPYYGTTLFHTMAQHCSILWHNSVPYYGTNHRHIMPALRTMCAALLLLVSFTPAWSQLVSDGIYYIKYGSNWVWPSTSYDDDNATYGTNTGNRFVTTYQAVTATAYTGANYAYDAHDSSYPHWVVKNVTVGENHYVQIINPRLNKYMIIRGSHTKVDGTTITYGDRDIWLADLTEENRTMSYFALVSGIKITAPSNGYGFNVAAGEKPKFLSSTNVKDANKSERNYRNGLIQLVSGGGQAMTFTPDLLTEPTITVTNDVVTVADNNSLPAGYNVRYTTDGTDPTASSDILSVGGYVVTGPGTFKAVIERYGIVLTNVASQAVEPSILRPTFTKNADGSVTITAETNNEIYYTLDGTDPTTSTGTHATTTINIPLASLQSATAIKAIAYKESESKTSGVATLPINTYTYKVINNSYKVVTSCDIKEAEGKPLTSYIGIPAAIRSEYLDNEIVTFYQFASDYAVNAAVPPATIEDTDPIEETPASGTTIYVTYSTTHVGDRFLPLTNASPYNIKYSVDSKFRYDESGLKVSESVAEYEADKKYRWYFLGEDPYDVTVQNAETNNYLTYSSGTLGSNADAQTFFLKGTASHGTTTNTEYENVTLRNAAGEEFTIRVNTIKLPISFTLIDKKHKVIESSISYEGTFALPEEWQSPLVSEYQYYKAATNNGGTYSFDPNDRIYNIGELGDNTEIFVTYTVNPSYVFHDYDEADLGNTGYRLQFLHGDSFRQENGSDALADDASEGIYPYANGDGCLYIYGTAQWDKQYNSGASTRPRWLWHLVNASENDHGDPYHVWIMSQSGIVNSHNFFRTYVVEYGDDNHLVTGVTTKNEAVDASHANQLPTEYMILKGSGGHCILKTLETINFGGENQRRVVTSFEQYFKNSPTVQNLLGAVNIEHKVDVLETYEDNINIDPAYRSDLPGEWHTYQAFARAEPWKGWKGDGHSGTGKQYLNKNHWFQTITMGATSEFDLVLTELKPQVILLDNHGWEIMRVPLSETEQLKKYDSPMVEEYHWYPSATKATGYHKYTVSDQQIVVYDSNRKATANRYIHNSKTLSDNPYTHIDALYGTQDDRVKTDFYVTYTVKAQFAKTYAGAADVDDTRASRYLVKQGGHYAKITGNHLASTTSGEEDALTDVIEEAPTDWQWYVKPYFDIDKEMGYQYDVKANEDDEDPISEATTNANYHTNGQSGFDPYNVQIQSVADPARYFRTNTSGIKLENGNWTGTSSTVETLNLKTAPNPQTADGYDQTTLTITNTTFMVVKDANGNMRLMPRFDHTKVMQSFTTLATPAATAPVNDDGTSAQSFTLTLVPDIVSKSSDIKAMGGYYKLASNFEVDESVGSAEDPFKGIIDGNLTPISTSVPLVAYADSAIIRNVIISSASVSSGASTVETSNSALGAICNYAYGATRIYNCGILDGSVGASATYVGGLVGLLAGNARVVNCYNFATITGGTNVAGIVGYNKVATTAALVNTGTMVMNCIFYGDITGGTTVSPVYGGQNINNLKNGLNTFNFYAYEKLKTTPITYVNDNNHKYNCALAVEERFLTRFEIYRQLLNSNRRLAANYASSPKDSVQAGDMMKWVLETADRQIANPKPYPVLKAQAKYPSIINYDVAHAPNYALVDGRPSEENRNKGGQLGTLSVTISESNSTSGGQTKPTDATVETTSLTLTRTDKDYEHFNYNYDKVQLPYYNDVGTKNYTGNKVVTGWKITSITTVDGDPYTSSNYDYSKDYSKDAANRAYFDGTNFNFSDRKSSQKDLYSVSGRVFSQGAYFDVPYGVTAITIEPYWGKAAYVADEYIDVVYDTGYGKQDVGQLPKTFSSGKITIDGSEQTVYTSISTALNALTGVSKPSVYDYAVVLVGNLHQGGVPSAGTKPFSLMSVDLDEDNEPDYSCIFNNSNRDKISPLRFDFLNIPGTAQAQKPNGAANLRNAAIFKTQGWFEITNTALMYFSQFEYENTQDVTKAVSPVILQGGVFDQFVATQNKAINGKTNFVHIGSNVWMKSFALGTHGDGSYSAPHVPISVTGGDIEGLYLTGTYNQNAGSAGGIKDDDAECYISGGRFGEVAGAGLEQLGNSTTKGNVYWQIYDADIDEFYGGGINEAKPIKGNITTNIFNSHVTQFCGGPKFGNMQTDKTVTTNAEGCVFGKYFGI